MEASMAANSRGAMPLYSSLRSKEITGMTNSRTDLRQVSLHSAFCDKSHMRCYAGTVKGYCGGKRDKLGKERLKGLEALYDGSLSEKRRIKLLELVSKDLSALSATFLEGVDGQKTLAEEVRGQIFSDAVQVLTAQLEQVKAERKQRKKEMKAQKKAQKQLQTKMQSDYRSSSESSDSECEAANTSQLQKAEGVTQIPDATVESPPKMADMDLNSAEATVLCREFAESALRLGMKAGEGMKGVKRVEVCMGGKCRKSGSEQLLGALEESIRKCGSGCRVEAVGCKCMGKCRSAPNLKVQSENGKQLLMAVEIANLDAIVDQHFGLQQKRNETAGSLVPL